MYDAYCVYYWHDVSYVICVPHSVTNELDSVTQIAHLQYVASEQFISGHSDG